MNNKRRVVSLALVVCLVLGVALAMSGMNVLAAGESITVIMTAPGTLMQEVDKVAPTDADKAKVKTMKVICQEGAYLSDWVDKQKDPGMPEEIASWANGDLGDNNFVETKFTSIETLDLTEARLRPANTVSDGGSGKLPEGQFYGLQENETIKVVKFGKFFRVFQGGAKNCPNLETFSMSNETREFGPWVNFLGCPKLKTFVLPVNPTYLKTVPGLAQNMIENVVIPEGYQMTKQWGLRQMPLTGVFTLPASIKELGNSTFEGSLTKMTAFVVKGKAPKQAAQKPGADPASSFWLDDNVGAWPAAKYSIAQAKEQMSKVYFIAPLGEIADSYNLNDPASQWSYFKLPTLTMEDRAIKVGADDASMSAAVLAGGAEVDFQIEYSYARIGAAGASALAGPPSTSEKGVYEVTATIKNYASAGAVKAKLTIGDTGEQYNVNISTVGKGTVTPSGNLTLDAGFHKELVITPDVGYKVKSLMVDGVDETKKIKDGKYTYNPSKNGKVVVTFVSGNNPSTGENVAATVLMVILAIVTVAGVAVLVQKKRANQN